jgi:DNA polymerase delta subunit 3
MEILTGFRMLFDFHKTQNEKQSESVHATYVVSGLKRQVVEVPAKDGDDTVMNSSPFPGSYMMSSAPQESPASAIRSISFAREEELQGSTARC